MEQGRRPVASGDGAEADEKLRAVIVAGHRGDAATVAVGSRRTLLPGYAPPRSARSARAGALTVADVVNAVARPLSRGSPPCLRRDGRARWTG